MPQPDEHAGDDRVLGEADRTGARIRPLPSLMTADERTCLMRCSMVRKFDRALFFRHFQCGEVRLEEDLVARHWIETDKKEDNPRYWVSRRLREAGWRLWWPDGPVPAVAPEPLRELSAEVADYCQQKGWHIERLRQEAVADRGQVESLFVELFQEGDERFDLAYCQDLVDVLTEEERTSFIPQSLRDRRDAGQRRITTRALRDSDFYQTRASRFQPREEAEDALRGLLHSSPGYWLLQLHGPGGIGKTTLLRWFVSRACVTADQTIPAAIINCDDFDAATILSQPWLLLIEAAKQLNDQLPEVPFRELVSERDSSSQGTSIASAVTGDPQRLEHIGQQVENIFCANACTGTPFVIALDGLDFISLESRAKPKALRDLVGLLRRVHDRVSDLRVVLSGRDDLRELVPELSDEHVRNHEVCRFTEAEASKYLRRRGITGQDKLTAILDKSDCLPMVIGLYADWLATDDRITVRQITEYSKPQVSYLVTRILRRIPDAIVRYTLLYSVTAPPSPALEFKFFRDVLLAAWRLPPPVGRRRSDLDIGPLPDPEDVPAADDVATQDQLWAEVLKHAEQAKWISVVEFDGEKVVKVHADVRLELIAQLRVDGAVRQIHELAAGHYQGKADLSHAEGPPEAGGITGGPLGAVPGLPAEQLGGSWPALTARALYHRIQHDDPAAIDHWRATVRQSRSQGRIDWIRDIAGLTTRQPDFLAATALLVRRAGTPSPQGAAALPDLAVLLPILYECHVELARIAAQAAGLLPGPQDTMLVPELPLSADAINNALTVRDGANARKIEISRADYEPIVCALNEVAENQFDTALHDLDTVGEFPPAAGTANGDAWLVRARARAARYRDSDPAARDGSLGAVLDAFAAARGAHAGYRGAATYVAVDAAQWLLDIDRPDLALQWCARAPDEWRPAHPEGAAAEVKARALLALGRPARAIEVLSPPDDMVTTAACSLAVAAHLALYRPSRAMQEYPGPADDLPSRRIERELLGAEAARELLDPNAAEACFGRAQACLLLLGQADEGFQARINTAQALFELRATGNIQKARAYLKDEFDRASVGDPTWTEYQLARAELADRRGHDDRVTTILDEVFKHLRDTKAPVSARVKAIVAGLSARSIGPQQRRKYLQSLIADLAEAAAPARIAMLTGLTRCLPVPSDDADDTLGERLRNLVTAEQEEPGTLAAAIESTDLAWRQLVISLVFRVTGATDDANVLRANALWKLGDDPFARWRLLGSRPEPRPEPDDTPRIAAGSIPAPHVFGTSYAGYPVLLAAYAEEWASRQPDKWAPDVSPSLGAAKESLERSPWLRPTAWHAKLYQAIATCERPFTRETDPRADRIWIALGVSEAPKPAAGFSPERSLPTATGEIVISGVERGREVLVSRGAPGSKGLPGGQGIDVTRFRFDIDRPTRGWAAELGGALAPVMGALTDRNVRLDLRRPLLAADPWELATVDGTPLAAHQEARFVFRTASSALSEQHTYLVQERVARALQLAEPRRDVPVTSQEWRDAIASLRQRWAMGGRRPLRVHVIHPMIGGSLDSERRFGERRRELERLYRTAFPADAPDGRQLDLRTLYGSQVSTLYTSPLSYSERPARDWADVIHVCTVMEATEQMPVLDLEISDGPPLTARQLDLLVQRLTGSHIGNPPPIVVLDVFAPPSPVEARRQLLMRNRFAQQLLTLGGVGTIIATGLGDPRASSEQWRLIATGLAHGQNAAVICRNIQRYPLSATGQVTDTEVAIDTHAIAFPATALFTSVHPDRLVPPVLFSRIPHPSSG